MYELNCLKVQENECAIPQYIRPFQFETITAQLYKICQVYERPSKIKQLQPTTLQQGMFRAL